MSARPRGWSEAVLKGSFFTHSNPNPNPNPAVPAGECLRASPPQFEPRRFPLPDALHSQPGSREVAGLCLKLLRGDTGEREVVVDGGCWAQVTTHQLPSRTARKEGSGNSGTSGLGCCSQKRSFPGLNLAPGDSLAPRDGLG